MKNKLLLAMLLFSAATFGQAPSACYYVAPLIRGYLVTFDSRGGSAVAPQEVAYSGRVKPPVKPTLAEYTFGGWYLERECINAWSFTASVVTQDMVLYARWLCTVTLNGMGGLPAGTGRILVSPGDTAAYPTPNPTHRNPNRVFAGWYADECRAIPYSFGTPVTKNVMIYAKWEER